MTIESIGPYIPLLLIIGFGGTVFLNRKKLVVEIDDNGNVVETAQGVVDESATVVYDTENAEVKMSLLEVKTDHLDGPCVVTRLTYDDKTNNWVHVQVSDVFPSFLTAFHEKMRITEAYEKYMEEATTTEGKEKWERNIAMLSVHEAGPQHQGYGKFQKEGK